MTCHFPSQTSRAVSQSFLFSSIILLNSLKTCPVWFVFRIIGWLLQKCIKSWLDWCTMNVLLRDHNFNAISHLFLEFDPEIYEPQIFPLRVLDLGILGRPLVYIGHKPPEKIYKCIKYNSISQIIKCSSNTEHTTTYHDIVKYIFCFKCTLESFIDWSLKHVILNYHPQSIIILLLTTWLCCIKAFTHCEYPLKLYRMWAILKVKILKIVGLLQLILDTIFFIHNRLKWKRIRTTPSYRPDNDILYN